MSRERRLAQNEALFREVNERLREVSELSGTAEGGLDVVCECADEDCVERIGISLADYVRLRAHPRRFLVVPGHELEIERVVEERRGYRIVEKEGEAGSVAEATAEPA